MKLYRKSDSGPYVVFASGDDIKYHQFYDIGVWISLDMSSLAGFLMSSDDQKETWSLSEWEAADHYNTRWLQENVSWLELLIRTGITKNQLREMIEKEQNGRR